MRLPLALSLFGLLTATGVLQSGCGGGSGGATGQPAGEAIVFRSNRDGQYEIYVMNGDGSRQTRLTNNQILDQEPAWSSDARRITFASQLGPALPLSESGTFEIMVMNADGTGLRRLTNNGVEDDRPSFSPDGSKIVFRSTRDNNSDIYIMNADGTDQQRLTTSIAIDRAPTFTPDGRILYTQQTENLASLRICRINSDGSGFTILTNGPSDELPSISRDGSRIVFTARPDANNDIFMINADGSNRTRLTSTPDNERAPAFSADGRRIIFAWFVNGNTDIYEMNADGSNANNPTRITTHPQTDTEPNVR